MWVGGDGDGEGEGEGGESGSVVCVCVCDREMKFFRTPLADARTRFLSLFPISTTSLLGWELLMLNRSNRIGTGF